MSWVACVWLGYEESLRTLIPEQDEISNITPSTAITAEHLKRKVGT